MARCFCLIGVLSAFLLLAQSCTVKLDKADVSPIKIVWNDDGELPDIKEYFDIDTIKLETSSDCLIGNITRVQIVGNRIIVYDSPNNQMLVFSSEGNFINRIGRKGQGPNEYTGIHDFFIKTDKVYIYDFNQGKILEYDLDGRHLSSVSLSGISHIDKIIPLDEGGYITLNTYSNASECPKFSWLDDEYKVKLKSGVQRLNGSSLNNVFCNKGDSLIYWEMMNDTIFSLKNGDVIPLYRIDFSRYSLPEYLDDINQKIDYYSKNSSTTACFVNNVIDTDRFLSFTFAHNLYTYWVIWNKENKKIMRFRLAYVGEWGCLQYVIAYEDNEFIGVFLPDHEVSDDNPYLMKLKLKDGKCFDEMD